MDVERLDAVLLRQHLAQCVDGAVVADAVAVDDILKLGAERKPRAAMLRMAVAAISWSWCANFACG